MNSPLITDSLPKILVSDGLDAEVFNLLRQRKDFDVYEKPKIERNLLKDLLFDANALILRSNTQVDSDLLSQAHKLKIVIRAGEGTDNIDLAACQAKKIIVENTPGANNNSAAEHALALMLTLLRKTAWADAKMKSGGWDKNLFVGNELTGKKVGILGFGKVGQLLAKRLSGFEPELYYFDPFVPTPPESLSFAKPVESIKYLFSKCDILSIHLPKLEETKNLIGATELSFLKRDALLINCARGGIVVEEDLITALRENHIKGAALDVFESEPLGAQSALRNLTNVVLTPHLGASTEEAQKRVGRQAIHQLEEFFLQGNVLNEVKR